MNTEKFILEESDIYSAQRYCSLINDEDIKNRATTNLIAAGISSKIFNDSTFIIDNESSLCRLIPVASDIDISDVYVNGYYIDVRICTENDELKIPVSHFDNNLLPVAYMFVKISPDYINCELLGFILPDNVEKNREQNGYYLVSEEQLVTFYDIEDYIRNINEDYQIDEFVVYDYIDGTINNKIDFYKYLLSSKEGRFKLRKALKAQTIFSKLDFDLNDFNENELSVENEFIEQEEEFSISNAVRNEETEVASESDFEYSTVASPSSADIINSLDIQDVSDKNVDEPSALSLEDLQSELSNNVDVTDNDASSEEIDRLFYDNEVNQQDNSEGITEKVEIQSYKKNKSSPMLFISLLIVLLGAGGYYIYNNFANRGDNNVMPKESSLEDVVNAPDNEGEVNADAMPVESVLPSNNTKNKNEGTAVAIPAIEQNLDASILVSNLKVDWEVPAGYVSNTSAKRYLVKLGKIIQLNLKTELLLLSKPPITNKISVEIRFNDSTKKFETVKIVTSSGEESIDRIILNTVNNALNMNISVNTDSFGKLQGNPVLIIRL